MNLELFASNAITAQTAVDQVLEERHQKTNPCIAAYGLGPAGEICRDCAHLKSHQPSRKRFYKCDLRKFTCGPGSDHKVRWPACAKFEPRTAQKEAA